MTIIFTCIIVLLQHYVPYIHYKHTQYRVFSQVEIIHHYISSSAVLFVPGCQNMALWCDSTTAAHGQAAVTAYLKSMQLLLFSFTMQNNPSDLIYLNCVPLIIRRSLPLDHVQVKNRQHSDDNGCGVLCVSDQVPPPPQEA